MPTDKQLLIDLTALTPESASQLASMQDDLAQELEKAGKRRTNKKTSKPQLTSIIEEKDKKQERKRAQKERIKKQKTKKISKKKLSEDFPLQELFSGGLGNLIAQQIKAGVLKFGPLLLVTGVFVEQLLKLNQLNKKFLDIANTRISVFIERQQQALIETFQNQVIYTTKAGVTSARDVYNSYNIADTANKNNGIERDVTSFGGID